MTMATLFEILEGLSYNSMITKDRYIIRSRKNSIIVAKSKNIIIHSKLQGHGACIFYWCCIFVIHSTIK